jgi:hypothetical protein
MALTTAQLGIMSDALAAVKNSIPDGVNSADQVSDPSLWDSVTGLFSGNAGDNVVIAYDSYSRLYADYSANQATTTTSQFTTFVMACKASATTDAWNVLNLDSRIASLPSEQYSSVDPLNTLTNVKNALTPDLKGAGDWIVIVLALVLAIIIFAKKKG